SLSKITDCNHVIVLNDRETAAYFHNDLEYLTGALDISYFPDSFKRPGVYQELNSSHVMLRTEALMRLKPHTDGQPVKKKILVTYPDALFEKVVDPRTLSANAIYIKTGMSLQIEAIMQQLVELGFTREDFVYEPGSFAMRGDILDIYSFGNEHPYRIELFGDEVESIRIFNPETQLSDRKLIQVSILPNIKTEFEPTEKVGLSTFLPENTVFWIQDVQFLLDRISRLTSDLLDWLEKNKVAVDREESWLKNIVPEDFVTAHYWESQLVQRHIVTWDTQEEPKKIFTHSTNITFSTEDQPVFNRQFNLLMDDLKQRIAGQYTIF